MNIIVLTSSRADYGIYLPLLKKLKADSFFNLKIVAFGTHLSKKHGETVHQIYADGFEVAYKVETLLEGDSPIMISKSMAITMEKFADLWEKEKSNIDLVICLGDRYEMFAAVSASLPFNLKIAHFHGGETSLGAIDESFRHSITAMSNIHFTSTEKSAARVAAIKGTDKGVYCVGAMSLDNLREIVLLTEKEFETKFGVLPEQPVLVTFHPETVAFEKNEEYCKIVIEVLNTLSQQIFITLPNADTFGDSIRKMLLAFSKTKKNVFCFESLGVTGYFSAMKFSSCLLGNTSSGIIEAASFGKYVINIGDRQKGREAGSNIIHCAIKKEEIVDAIEAIKSMPLLKKDNIYGNGNSSAKVILLFKKIYE